MATDKPEAPERICSNGRCGPPNHETSWYYEDAAVSGPTESYVRATSAADAPQLTVDELASRMTERDENWRVSYGRGTKLWTVEVPWHDIKVNSKKLAEAFRLAETELLRLAGKGNEKDVP